MTNQPTQPPRDWASVMPKLAELTDNFLFGEIWERPQLSKRDRSVITVAVLTALYRPNQLTNHLNRALDNGVTPEELSEIITHVTFYAGWPTGANAGPILKEVLDKRGLTVAAS
jgi:4-carboxymuconolactone decarboxylase